MTNKKLQKLMTKKGYDYVDKFGGVYYKNYDCDSVIAFIKPNKTKENYSWLDVSMIVENQKDIESIIKIYNDTKQDMIDIDNLNKSKV